MPQGFDALNGLQLVVGGTVLDAEAVALDEFDRLEQTARRFALPDLAEAAFAQGFEEPVAGDRFRVWFLGQQHDRISDCSLSSVCRLRRVARPEVLRRACETASHAPHAP